MASGAPYRVVGCGARRDRRRGRAGGSSRSLAPRPSRRLDGDDDQDAEQDQVPPHSSPSFRLTVQRSDGLPTFTNGSSSGGSVWPEASRVLKSKVRRPAISVRATSTNPCLTRSPGSMNGAMAPRAASSCCLREFEVALEDRDGLGAADQELELLVEPAHLFGVQLDPPLEARLDELAEHRGPIPGALADARRQGAGADRLDDERLGHQDVVAQPVDRDRILDPGQARGVDGHDHRMLGLGMVQGVVDGLARLLRVQRGAHVRVDLDDGALGRDVDVDVAGADRVGDGPGHRLFAPHAPALLAVLGGDLGLDGVPDDVAAHAVAVMRALRALGRVPVAVDGLPRADGHRGGADACEGLLGAHAGAFTSSRAAVMKVQALSTDPCCSTRRSATSENLPFASTGGLSFAASSRSFFHSGAPIARRSSITGSRADGAVDGCRRRRPRRRGLRRPRRRAPRRRR